MVQVLTGLVVLQMVSSCIVLNIFTCIAGVLHGSDLKRHCFSFKYYHSQLS